MGSREDTIAVTGGNRASSGPKFRPIAAIGAPVIAALGAL